MIDRVKRAVEPYHRLLFPVSYHRRVVLNCSPVRSIMTRAEHYLLFDTVKAAWKTGHFLEVGSYLGGSAVVIASALAKHRPEAKSTLYCVDTWQNDAMQEDKRDTFAEFSANTARWRHLVVPIRANSFTLDVADIETPLDMAFIDADHSYDGCKSDVDRFAPMIREGGRLVFHDHISYPGVTQVVSETLATGLWFIGGVADNLLVLVKYAGAVGKPHRVDWKKL